MKDANGLPIKEGDTMVTLYDQKLVVITYGNSVTRIVRIVENETKSTSVTFAERLRKPEPEELI
jgi:hypothetical protein